MQSVPLCISTSPGISSIRTAQFTLWFMQQHPAGEFNSPNKSIYKRSYWHSSQLSEPACYRWREMGPYSAHFNMQSFNQLAKGVKSQLKLIPPWGCRQVCSSTSACTAEDGITETCPSWEGRHLLHLPAEQAVEAAPCLLSSCHCCSPLVKATWALCITLDHWVMLNKLILPEIDWAVLAWSLFLSQLSCTRLLQWQIIVSNILSSTAASQNNAYL